MCWIHEILVSVEESTNEEQPDSYCRGAAAMFVSRRVRGHGVRTGTSAAAEGRSKTIAAASEGDLDGRALDVETPHVGVGIRVLGKEATRCVGAGALGRARAQARLGFGALAALVVALPLRWSRPNPNPVNLHGQDSRAWPPGESVSKAIPKRVRARKEIT